MPIQVIAPIRDQGLQEQLALSQVLAQGARGYQDYQRQQKAQRGEDALVSLLAGAPGQGPKPLNPGAMGEQNALAAALSGGPAVQGPPTAPSPGLIPGITREEALNYAQSGLGPTLAQIGLEQRFPGPVDPVAVREGGALVDPRTGQVVYQAPGATKPPQMRDRLEGGERVFEQYNAATGGWDQLSAGPAFAPPTQINVGPTGPAATVASMAPGAMSDIAGIAQQLVDPSGAVNTQLLATMNVPGLNMAVPGTAGAQMRSALEGAMDTMVRIRTGAAASEQELAQMREIYMPSAVDTPQTVKSKMDRLQRDLGASLAIATQGKAVPESTRPAAPAEPAQPGIVDQLIGQGMNFLQGGAGSETTATAPQVGAIEDGFRFKGGNPSDPNSWEKVQ